MPNGFIHTRATLTLAVAGGVIAYRLGYPVADVAALTGGTLAGLLLTPDLDVNKGCVSNHLVRRHAGLPLSILWSAYWKPYSQIIPHRSRLSHLPVLGTFIRLAYLCILPAIIMLFAGGGIIWPDLPAWSSWALGGLVLADVLHYVMDRLF